MVVVGGDGGDGSWFASVQGGSDHDRERVVTVCCLHNQGSTTKQALTSDMPLHCVWGRV